MDAKLLRQKILDLAIHGKLVSQDPNDEPASVLLERIRAEKEKLVQEGKIKKSKASATSDKHHYENPPFEIPESWELVPIEELFILNPKTHTTDAISAGFVPMAYVEDGFSGLHSYELREWGKIRKGFSHFQNGDIGIAKISPCFENLKSTVFQNLPNTIGAGTTELVILRAIAIDVWFYLNLFKSTWYIAQGTKYFKGVVGQQRVNKEIFTTLHIPLPPLAEQKRIVAEIEKYFALIDEIEKNKTDLAEAITQIKSKILDLAIHGKLVPQDPNDEPAIELLKRINPDFTPCLSADSACDNEHYGEIPQGWTICKLKDCVTCIKNGAQIRQDKSGKGLPITRIETISRGMIDRNRMGYANIMNAQDYSEYLLQNGDILMSHINSAIHVGKAALCEDIGTDEYIIHGMNLLCIRPNDIILPKYLLQYFRTTHFYNLIKPYIKNAVNQASINIGNLSTISIALPPLAEQQRIVAKIEQLFAVLDSIQSSLEA